MVRMYAPLLAALVLSGCAAFRTPAPEPPPVRLAEVNEALRDKVATVHFFGDRRPETGFVQIGPSATVIRPLDAEQEAEPSGVLTSVILRVEIPNPGAIRAGGNRGALWGSSAGVATGVASLIWSVSDPAQGVPGIQRRQSGSVYTKHRILASLGMGGVGALGGFYLGRKNGAQDRRRVIYEGPITRYPDAALALLDRLPLAEPAEIPTPEATER